MTINTGQFEINLLKKLNASSDPSDIQALVTAKKSLKYSDVVVVSNYSDLPAASSVPAGSLYFVEADELTYIPAQSLFGQIAWRPLYDMEYSAVWGFGDGALGRLGDNTTVNKSSSVSVVGGFTDWVKVSAGGSHTAAIRQNGTLWAWGGNSDGRLGTNSVTNISSPVQVCGGFTDWCQVSAGNDHTAAVRTNGTLWTWGCNTCGKLGDITTVNKSSPVSVAGGFTDWCQVSDGPLHTAAVRTNGTLWTWGLGTTGRLGTNSTVNRSSPTCISGTFTDWCQVSAGCAHTAAVRQNGTLWTWGCATNGILGTNSTVSRSSPVSVVGDFTDWCQVSVGFANSAAIRQNGTLWSWGANSLGQVGDNTTVAKSSPVSVVGGFTDWCQLEVGIGCAHTLAIRTNGTIWGWGSGANGRLGNNSIANRSSPVSAVGNISDWCQVTTGGAHTMAIRKKVF